MKKINFPYQIHLILGIIWCFIGITFHSGVELIIWIGGGLVIIVIGLLNRKAKTGSNIVA